MPSHFWQQLLFVPVARTLLSLGSDSKWVCNLRTEHRLHLVSSHFSNWPAIHYGAGGIADLDLDAEVKLKGWRQVRSSSGLSSFSARSQINTISFSPGWRRWRRQRGGKSQFNVLTPLRSSGARWAHRARRPANRNGQNQRWPINSRKVHEAQRRRQFFQKINLSDWQGAEGGWRRITATGFPLGWPDLPSYLIGRVSVWMPYLQPAGASKLSYHCPKGPLVHKCIKDCLLQTVLWN